MLYYDVIIKTGTALAEVIKNCGVYLYTIRSIEVRGKQIEIKARDFDLIINIEARKKTADATSSKPTIPRDDGAAGKTALPNSGNDSSGPNPDSDHLRRPGNAEFEGSC